MTRRNIYPITNGGFVDNFGTCIYIFKYNCGTISSRYRDHCNIPQNRIDLRKHAINNPATLNKTTPHLIRKNSHSKQGKTKSIVGKRRSEFK
jgi:hypothetical protein